MDRANRRPTWAMAALVALLYMEPGGALSANERTLQVTSDSSRVLINKDVGEERWAITYDLRDDRVTGNVYFQTGAPAAFFDCTNLTPNDRAAVNLRCSISNPGCGASSPNTASCPRAGEWESIDAPTLPRSFFGLAASTCGNGNVEDGELCDDSLGTIVGECADSPELKAVCVNCQLLCVEGDSCGGIDQVRCRDGEVCLPPDGSCEIADVRGTCIVPGACPAVVDPVCGCDGQTYPNECEAHSKGVAVDRKGDCTASSFCRVSGEACSSDTDCRVNRCIGPNQMPFECSITENGFYRTCASDAGCPSNDCVVDGVSSR